MNGKALLKDKERPKRERKKTFSQLKKILDKLVSEYIRRLYADKEGNVRCYTCGKQMNWKESQCGHFASRLYLNTRYDERNLRVQCVGCNVFGNGKVAKFAERLEKETPGIVAELYRTAQGIVKNFPYEEKIEYYKKKLLELNEKRND